MTTGKIIALTRWTFVGKVMSLLFNMLSIVITFLPRSKHLVISWLQSQSVVITPNRMSIIKIAMKNINNLRYADDTTLIAESKEPLDEGEKGK